MPRISSIISTMDVPSKVYARVVVTMIAEAQSPESADHRVGLGKLCPSTVTRLAVCHQPVASRKVIDPTRHAMPVAGRSTKPSTRPDIPGIAPSERALVSAL
jgi:hypothetical protein